MIDATNRTQEFKIRAKLPSMNDIIKASRSSRYQGAALKRDTEEMIMWYVAASGVHKVNVYPVEIRITFYETGRRDIDGAFGGIKMILDALVKKGVLIDDRPKCVGKISASYEKAKEYYVKVEIEEGQDAISRLL